MTIGRTAESKDDLVSVLFLVHVYELRSSNQNRSHSLRPDSG